MIVKLLIGIYCLVAVYIAHDFWYGIVRFIIKSVHDWILLVYEGEIMNNNIS